jgi:hypothetical protein
VEGVIVKTQEEMAEKAHTTALSGQKKATGNQWYESRTSHLVFSGIPRKYIR